MKIEIRNTEAKGLSSVIWGIRRQGSGERVIQNERSMKKPYRKLLAEKQPKIYTL